MSKEGRINDIESVNDEITLFFPQPNLQKGFFNYSDHEKHLSEGDKPLYKIYTFLKILLVSLPLIIATIIYIITLDACNDTVFECVQRYKFGTMKLALFLVLTSAFFYILQFYFHYMRITNYKHSIVTILIIMFLCFIYDTGSDFSSHGAYNRLALFFFFLIWTILFVIFNCMCCYNFKRGGITLGIVFLFLIFIRIKIGNRFETSCDGWELGFKNSKIDNSEGQGCIIEKPKVCYLKALRGFFDFSGIFGETCQKLKAEKFSVNVPLLNNQTKMAKIIGFPRTEKWPQYPDSLYNIIQMNVMKNVVDMEKASESVKNTIEATVNYYKEPPELSIHLKKNQTLINEKTKIFNAKSKDVMNKNVIYVFMDSLSRVEFKRKLPKFWSWMEKHYKVDDTTYIKNKYESFQFFKYHGTGMYTGQNMCPNVFGVFNWDYGGIHYLHYYNLKGYITGQATSYCGREVFDIENGAIEKMKWSNFDHELVSPFCDLNHTPAENKFTILTGVNRIGIRCLYRKSVLEYSLEYLHQFWNSYKNEAKFFRLFVEDGHEGTGEAIQYADPYLADFFENFGNEGGLDDTILYIQTDHGVSMVGPYSAMVLEDWKHELVLPSLFLVMPTNMKNYAQIRDNLYNNENRIISQFDVYKSVLSILNDKDIRGDNNSFPPQDKDYIDIFNSKIDKERGCDAFYNEEYYSEFEYNCRCTPLKKLRN